MSEYIIWESDKTETTDYLGVKHGVSHFEKREEIVRCRDCKHATISTMGVCKYCEMFVLPDTDGYGADPQVNLPLDFFCAWGEKAGRMSEYIIDWDENLVIDTFSKNSLREEIVRCRDCVHYKPYRTHKHGMMNRCHDEHGHTHKRDETDFCSRGEKADNFTTCKCGENIETNGRESVTCPSCGRVITE